MDFIDLALKTNDKEWFKKLCDLQNKSQAEIYIEDMNDAKTVWEMDALITQILSNTETIENIDVVMKVMMNKYILLNV